MSSCRIGQNERCKNTGCEWEKGFGFNCHGEKIKTIKCLYTSDEAIKSNHSVTEKPSIINKPKIKNKHVGKKEIPAQEIPVTIGNFFVRTYGEFTEINEIPEGFSLFYSSKGSQYYTNEAKDTLIRSSDHWGWNIAFCCWYLIGYKKCVSWRFQKHYGKESKIGLIKISELAERILRPEEISGNKLVNKESFLRVRHEPTSRHPT